MNKYLHADLRLVPISAAVASGWDRFANVDKRRVIDKISEYLATLVESLEIPADPTLEISEDIQVSVNTVRLNIEGRTFHVSIEGVCHIVPDESSWESPSQMIMHISRAVFSSRERLLTKDVVNRIWQSWGHKRAVKDYAMRHWLLAEAARYGFRMGRVRVGFENEDDIRISTLAEAQNLFESSLRGAGVGTLGMRLSRSLYEHSFDLSTRQARPLGGHAQGLLDMLDIAAHGLFDELGIRIAIERPSLDSHIPQDGFQLTLNEMPLPVSQGLKANEFMVNTEPENLLPMGLDARSDANPANGLKVSIVTGGLPELMRCEEAELPTTGPEGYAVLQASELIRRHSGACMTPDLWWLYVMQLLPGLPQLISNTLVSHKEATIVRTLRYLVEEQISIRNLKYILEVLTQVRIHIPADINRYIAFSLGSSIAFGAGEKRLEDFTIEDYATHVRISLMLYINYKVAGGSSTLWCYLVDPAVEEWLENCDDPITDIRFSMWLADARAKIDNADQRHPVILTNANLRGRVRRLIAAEFPRVPVLCYAEITQSMDLEPIARIAF